MADNNTTAEKKNKLQWIENISILIIDVFLFYLTIIRTGAITSGIHLVDDHEAVYNDRFMGFLLLPELNYSVQI